MYLCVEFVPLQRCNVEFEALHYFGHETPLPTLTTLMIASIASLGMVNLAG
jgi:hypothetical protein